MARPAAPARRIRPATWIGAGAVTAVIGVVTTLAVVWPGYDAQQTPIENASVWAMQNGAGSGYARVNLDLLEVDTVKQVENGSALAQTGDDLFVFSDGGAQFSNVDMARPLDLTADAEDAFTATPSGTEDIASAGDTLVYRTDAGGVFGSSLSGGGEAVAIDPYAGVEVAEGEERPRFAATAVAAGADGTAYAYSAAESRVVRAEAATGRIIGEDATPAAPEAAQLSVVGTRWVLFDEATGEVFVRGRDAAIETDAGVGAVLQQSTPTGVHAYLADPDGLVRITLEGDAARVVDDSGLGAPAAPTALDGVVHAAWLGDGETGGTLWSSADEQPVELAYEGADIGESPQPAFVGNGSRLALNDRSSGWVWTVPDGRIVPSSQQWDLDEQAEVEQQEDATSERVLDPKPPVAVDDAFGVRAGSVALLPVLLNDHDPNEDVLSIDPASLENVDPAFGVATITGAEQQLALSVSPDATGSATLRYRVTDGTSADGLYSNVATVTVTVVPADQNTPPVWCGVDGCLASWPSLTVAPGGTVSAELLDGWVDPEGDPIYLAGATNDSGVGTVTTSPEGTLTYQHPDPNAPEALTVSIGVTVSDARGATVTQPLSIQVTPTPELRAESFAMTGVVGEPVDISVSPYVTGAAGPLTLSNVVPGDEALSTATANPGALSMVFTATQPGSYLVQYTVRDSVTEASAMVRITMQASDATVISTPPLTAFVRPNEDATIDVFPAVANPGGLVLLLSDIRPESDPLASMGVDLVGQSLLRVSGTTDDGTPGRLGVVRYTVSDGTGRAGATAQGELTVILLPSASAEPPIAVDDAVTVRAGTQIDIPVLENDSSPQGALIAIDPSSIVNETGGGLAFATSRLVRYLAPDEAGTYALSYTIFRLGFPEAVDTARVTITVVGDETNQAPLPRTLVGRVLSGQSVTIPLDGYAVDPDGDPVVLDRIVEQPAQGSATISADGSAIVYTSPDEFSGQERFRYQVRDPDGLTGVADVRVGVIDTQTDPSPVTYSDYLQVQVGADSTAVVSPADNDVDPAGSDLELLEVKPNAQEGTAEFDALSARLMSVEDGLVTLSAGDALGTFSYTYTVRNEQGDTAIGLIVVKVVRDPVPDYPVVRDTVLTIENREDFPDGVDVLDGKVSWSSGDAAALDLRLWGEPAGIEVAGARISGELPERSLLIPFEVTGAAFDGSEVTSYGFLRVPGDADMRLALREGLAPLQVREKETVEFDMTDGVSLPRGQGLVVDAGGVRSGGARAEASCTLVSGTTVRYTAGTGAPWTDSCVVPVRLEVQDTYTYLTLRVQVEAEIPQPSLRSASLTVSPGSTQTYDLAQMVQWAGKEDWDAVQYAGSYGGDQFEYVQEGATVTVTAKDAARPGRQEPVAITLPSHADARPANLLLTVGPAPSTLPKGGATVQTCSQSGGTTSCTIDVIGSAGEVNPLPGTPLRLVGASGGGNCRGVSFARASDTSVRATWAADAPGAAECIGTFTVEDAQGRQSSGDRNGQVVLDLQGLPANPTRMEWTAFSGDTVTLRVTSDSSSYPAVEGYRITRDGREVASCPASGSCSPINAPVGEKINYEARAVSSVGDSRATVRAEAWAYRAPAQPTGSSFTPVPNGRDGGRADIVVTGLDATAGSVRLTGGRGGERVERVSGGSATFRGYDIGQNTPTNLTATPLTAYDLPPIPGGSSAGRELVVSAHGIGAPSVEIALQQTGEEGSIRATASVSPNGRGDEILVSFVRGDRACSPGDHRVSAGGGDVSETITGLDLWTPVQITACATTQRDGQTFGDTSDRDVIIPLGDIDAPSGDATYSVGTRADQYNSNGARVFEWNRITKPNLRGNLFFEVRYSVDGNTWTSDFNSLFQHGGRPAAISAALCSDAFGCGTATARQVTAVDPGMQYTARVQFPDSCSVGEAPRGDVEVLANPSDYDILPVTTEDRTLQRVYTYTVQWKNQLATLGTTTHSKTCTLPPPVVPDPEPTDPGEDDGGGTVPPPPGTGTTP